MTRQTAPGSHGYSGPFAPDPTWCRGHPMSVLLPKGGMPRVAAESRLTIRHSKTHQDGVGKIIAIVRSEVACPVAALRDWLRAADITEGPVFRPIRRGGHVQEERLTDRSVSNIVKSHAERVGLDPTLFSGHSLRAGFLTSAAKRGASIFKMMATSRHRSTASLVGYVRDQELFVDHAGSGLL
jgi:integrase